jgi:ABC-type nitrate/sulfonate/bicarbonate transport system substrate-binding protein
MIKRYRTRAAGAIALLLAAALLASCSSSKSSANSGSGAPKAASGQGPAKITFGLTGGPVVYEVSHFAAMNDGSLASAAGKYGTKVETQDFGSGPDVLAALASGAVNFVLLGAHNVLGLNTKGQGLVGLAILAGGGQTVLVGAKKYEASRGTDLKKYDGAKWGFTKPGSQGEAECIAIAQKAGLNWSKQKGIAVGTISAYMPALQSGRADLVDMDPSTAAKAIASGVGYALVNTQDANSLYPYQAAGMTLIAKKSFVDKYPQLVKAVVQAEVASSQKVEAQAGDPQAILNMQNSAFKAANGSTWKTMWPLMSPAYVGLTGKFTPTAISEAESFARLQFKIPASTKLDTSALTNDYQ